jgi:hypothetical protein
LTTTKVVTAPSYSKTYVVVNAATGGVVTFKASGQTGISVAVGESAFVYYNGTDYVKLTSTSSGAAGGSTTQVQYNNAGVLAGSANLTFDGTTLVANNFTDSSLTNGRVTYAGAAGNLVDNANFVFDGTNLGVGTASPSGRLHVANTGTAGTTADNLAVYFTSTNRNSNVYIRAKNTEGSVLNFGDGDSDVVGRIVYDHTSNYMAFDTNATERLRIASAGQIGIGGANYGTAGQVLTSGGASAAPTWATASGGSTSIGLVRAIAINCILC